MSNLIGQSIGRYHILEQLGEGGMATVYKAYDTRLEREVAFKVIRKDAFPPEQLERILKRFEREAKALARLTQPNIVGVIDYGDHEGAPYLVMPYLPGGTLKQKLGKPIPWREAVQLLLPVARALQFAHEQGIVHRDVKPANILTTLSGEPMLTDFGIAKILEETEGQTLTGTGVGIGTPEYMAPEQWTGTAGPQADIYSLGVVFYELITGRKPYTADTPAAILLKQASEPLPRPRQFVKDLPDAAEQVLFKALAKSPAERYADMGLFARALDGLLAAAPTASLPVTADGMTRDDYATEPDAIPTSVAPSPALPEKTPVAKTPPPARPRAERPAGGRRKPIIILILILSPILLCILACLGMWGFKLCPPEGPWPQPPWCPGSPYVWPFNDPIPLESPTPAAIRLPTATPAPDCNRADIFCVGMVTDVGSVNDRSFNQSIWEGLQQARQEGLADYVDYVESTNAADYEGNIRMFADNGYDVIVTNGFGLGGATQAAATEYPDIYFISVDYYQDWADNDTPEDDIPNLAGLVFAEDQAGFMAGALAALVTGTGRVGAVCATDSVPPVWRFCEGYRAGALYIASMAEVTVVYHNDAPFEMVFSDPEWGAATADSLIDAGNDIIFGVGGATGTGAIERAAERGAYVIGVDTDQYYNVPEAAARMLTSALKHIAPGVTDLIAQARDAQRGAGTFPAGNYMGEVGYAPYHDFESLLSPTTTDRMEEIRAMLQSGELQTGVPSTRP